MTVYRLLGELDYALKANRKRFTGPPHPDRDRQFAYIAGQRQRFAILGSPLISVDGKHKELIGNFKNPGRSWCRQAEEVNAHDFRDDALARAVPYGLYDPRQDRGWVYVGLSADTAEVDDAGVEAPAEQGRPDAIDVSASEPGILRAGQQARQRSAALAVVGVERY